MAAELCGIEENLGGGNKMSPAGRRVGPATLPSAPSAICRESHPGLDRQRRHPSIFCAARVAVEAFHVDLLTHVIGELPVGPVGGTGVMPRQRRRDSGCRGQRPVVEVGKIRRSGSKSRAS